jgi:8-amino-7-oxononanoate synthase
MMIDFEKFVFQQTQELKAKDLHRELKAPQGVDFCSNDYLGLSENKKLKSIYLKNLEGLPMGSTGSRLLRGNSDSFNRLENRLAQFSGQQGALYFSSGYQANLGLFSCLLKNQAVVFSDESIHASIIDGIRLSGCEKYIWTHNDLGELEMLLRQKAQDDKLNLVVVESIYSMQGDFAPLDKLVSLCQKYNAYLIVDEAHATGLFGKTGAGRVEELELQKEVLATIHTAGKAMGVAGAWVSGSKSLIELLINQCRPFIYTTAPAYFQQAAINASLEYLEQKGTSLREKFFKQLENFQSSLFEIARTHHLEVSGKGGPVTSLVLKENNLALKVMNIMAENSMDVRAIRPPTVPEGRAQLRITLPLSRTQEEIDKFLSKLSQILGENL